MNKTTKPVNFQTATKAELEAAGFKFIVLRPSKAGRRRTRKS